MTYILFNPDHTIKTFMDCIADVPLAEGETFAFSPLSMVEYSKRFVLSFQSKSSQGVIAHVGDPEIEIEVSAPGQESVSVKVNDQTQIVKLVDGKGIITLAATAPAFYHLAPADQQTFCAAGSGSLSVAVL